MVLGFLYLYFHYKCLAPTEADIPAALLKLIFQRL